MKRTLYFALAAMVAAPALAHADPDVSSDRFRVLNTSNSIDRTWGGGFASQDDYALRPIWCIDQTAFTNAGLEYDVWVTRTSGSDFSKTKLGNAGAAQYQMAAYMASFYTEGDGDLFIAGFGNASASALQSAIWRTMGGDGNPPGDISNGEFNQGTALLTFFGGVTLPTSFDFQYWYVVTAKAVCNPEGYNHTSTTGDCDYQEFLTYDPDRPQETVPEPATMTLLATGLAGMAAARRRRKS